MRDCVKEEKREDRNINNAILFDFTESKALMDIPMLSEQCTMLSSMTKEYIENEMIEECNENVADDDE